MGDYTKVEAWMLADDLGVPIQEITRSFPRNDLHGLTDQVRRAAIPVAANIVEGSGRQGKWDDLHFLYVACGSLSEGPDFVHLACRLGCLDTDRTAKVTAQGRRCFACLHGLIRAVEKETGGIAKCTAAMTSMVA